MLFACERERVGRGVASSHHTLCVRRSQRQLLRGHNHAILQPRAAPHQQLVSTPTAAHHLLFTSTPSSLFSLSSTSSAHRRAASLSLVLNNHPHLPSALSWPPKLGPLPRNSTHPPTHPQLHLPPPTLSAYTQSPGLTVTPAKDTGTSLRPLSRLADLSG